MSYDIRAGTPADAEAILELILDAFGLSTDSWRYPGNRSLAYNCAPQFRVMTRGDDIVAALHISDTWIQVGQCAVLKGDVGHVAVRTACQGEGLGTALMQDTVVWLRDNGYHLSRLGGLMHFYARFGYEPFVRRFVEFWAKEVHGGRKRVPATEVFPEPSGHAGILRPFDEARDWEARARIRYAFDNGRSGAERVSAQASPPTSPAPPDPSLLRFVYELDGDVKGHMFAIDTPYESQAGETCFTITDFAYLPSCPQAAGMLLRQLLARVAHHAPARVISRLPYDEAVAIALQSAGVTFHRVEMHQATAGNMIQVLSLPGTLEAILPELQARLAASIVADWSGEVALALPNEACGLRAEGGRLAVADCRAGACTPPRVDGPSGGVQAPALQTPVAMTQSDFVKLLFGITGVDELPCAREAALSPEDRAVLGALFPRCPTGSGPWG